MPVLKYKKCINYNQTQHFEDIKAGGNCFAYIVLFLTYITAYKQLFPANDIDYVGFNKVLGEWKDKKQLQDIQDKYPACRYSKAFKQEIVYPSYQLALDNNIAKLNENIEYNTTQNIAEVCKFICDDICHFKKPIFYTVAIVDDQRFCKMLLSHVVAMYLVSPKELHFFDANSGLYIIDLPDNLKWEDLRDTILELIFKKNLIMKWFFNSQSKSMEYTLTRSLNSHLTNEQQQIMNMMNDLLYSEEGYSSKMSALPISTQSFLERITHIVNIQRDFYCKDKVPNEFDRRNIRHYKHEDIDDDVNSTEMKTFKNYSR